MKTDKKFNRFYNYKRIAVYPFVDTSDVRFDVDEVPYMCDLGDIGDGELVLSDLNFSELVLLFTESPMSSILFLEFMYEFAERKDIRVVPLLEKALEERREAIKILEQRKLQYLIKEGRLEGKYIGSLFDHGFWVRINHELQDWYGDVRAINSTIREITGHDPIRNDNGMTDDILSRIYSHERLFGPGEEVQSVSAHVAASGSYELNGVRMLWSDFEETGFYVCDKELTVEMGLGPEQVVSLRKFIRLRYKQTGVNFFFSEYDPNEMFCMVCAQRFFHLLGLPTRQTHILTDNKGRLGLIREFFKTGFILSDYKIIHGWIPNYSPQWIRVARGSLLLDEIIGYIDRDDTNLGVIFNPQGDPIPLFVDMKFSFGLGFLEETVDYSFSRHVMPYEGTVKLPKGFAYNEFQISASLEDMRWMASRVSEVTRQQIEAIALHADELIKGHFFDVKRMVDEWWKAINMAVNTYL